MSRQKKHTENIHHEYISTKQYTHSIWFRLSNYFVLLSMLCIEKFFDIQFSDYVYLLVFSAIVGYDVTGILGMIDKFIQKRKRA